MRDNMFDVDKNTRQFGNAQRAMSEQFGRISEAWIKAAARAGNETSSLVGRRIRAYAEIPGRLGHCKTPMDLQSEQVRFWQSCAQDYAQATRAVVEAWSGVMPMMSPQAMTAANPFMAAFGPAFAMFGSAPATSGEEPRERDTLTMPERENRTPRPPHGAAYDMPRPGARRPAA